MNDIERYDHRQLRCPRLGHEVAFAYCRQEGITRPCPRIVRCWEGFLPVENFLREALGEEQWHEFCSQVPPDKMTSLLDLIAKAKSGNIRKE